ncbi:hypothetical protein HDV00_007948 [Rhizophlyctis rosea]|nr:hypothetical protein HDV00_007948 [Rhizophlyctis rosea]
MIHNPHTASLVLRRILNRLLVSLMDSCNEWELKWKSKLAEAKDVTSSSASTSTSSNPFQALETRHIQEELLEEQRLISLGWLSTGGILQVCERTIEGYFLIAHLLLTLAAEYPEIQQAAQKSVGAFISASRARIWESSLLNCSFEGRARNVFWLLDPEKGSGKGYLAYLEGKRVRMVVGGGGMMAGVRQKFSAGVLKAGLDQTYGYPPPDVAAQLVETIKAIYRVSDWDGFFARMDLSPPPSSEELCTLLKEAVTQSEKKAYHHSVLNSDELLTWRLTKESGLGSEQKGLKKENVKRTVEQMERCSFSKGNRPMGGGRGRRNGRGGGRGRGEGRGRGRGGGGRPIGQEVTSGQGFRECGGRYREGGCKGR